MKTLLNKKITIKLGQSSYQVNCKVTGDVNSQNDHLPYLLIIPGGPGFGLLTAEPTTNNILQQFKKENQPACHIILFDPLSCGESDKAKNPDLEYTPTNFTEVAAQVVEAIQQTLNIQNMDLRILGGSYGSLTAMEMPVIRPDWITNPDAKIKLNQIISLVGIVSYASLEEGMIRFVKQKYADDPQLHLWLASIGKLLNGNIESMQDYIDNIAFRLAPLYSDKYADLLNSSLGKLIDAHHNFSIQALAILGHYSAQCNYMHEALAGISLDVLNHFFKNKFNNFDLLKLIPKYQSLYESIPITCISGINDHIANPEWGADLLKSLLPDSLTTINYLGKHSDRTDWLPQLLTQLLRGELTTEFLEAHRGKAKQYITNYQLANRLTEQMQTLQALMPTEPKKDSGYAKLSLFSFTSVEPTEAEIKSNQNTTKRAAVLPP